MRYHTRTWILAGSCEHDENLQVPQNVLSLAIAEYQLRNLLWYDYVPRN
jgi:hypothetical protein